MSEPTCWRQPSQQKCYTAAFPASSAARLARTCRLDTVFHIEVAFAQVLSELTKLIAETLDSSLSAIVACAKVAFPVFAVAADQDYQDKVRSGQVGVLGLAEGNPSAAAVGWEAETCVSDRTLDTW